MKIAVCDDEILVAEQLRRIICRALPEENEVNIYLSGKSLLEEADAYDIIFLDPPYGTGMLEKALEMIAKIDIVTEHGIIVCESAAEAALPELSPPYQKGRDYRYGKIKITLYHRAV